jgi:iron complex transport system substrate-binding protein
MIEHVMGETCIPKNPKRIATISRFTLANALVLGIKPIGSTSVANVSQYKFDTYLKNNTEGIKQLGSQNEPNLEKILLLKPDLILGWKLTQTIYPLLSQIAPTVLGEWQGGDTSWREHFDFVAETLGKQEVAQKAWSQYYQRIEQLKISLRNRYKDKTISVISIFDVWGIQISTKNSFIGSIINDIGLQRPQAQNVIALYGRKNISEENLEEADGDILFIQILNNRGRNIFDELQKKPLWRTLKAVQQGQVYTVDALTWSGGNLLAANAVLDDLYKYLINTPLTP